jgi:5S rRNA maturation endonuclease (ribonuclease M5)
MQARISVSMRRLTERTGYERRTVSRAVTELKRHGFVNTVLNTQRTRTKRGKLTSQQYILRDPWKGVDLAAGTGTNVLYTNKVSYFTVPRCFITDSTKRWSLAQLTGSQAVLYFAVLWMANRRRSNEFTLNTNYLRSVSGLTKSVFLEALDQLKALGLIWQYGDRLHVCDPYTGEPLIETDVTDHDPQNYYTVDKRGRDIRLDLNLDFSNPSSVSYFIQHTMGYKGPIFGQGTGDLMICCPFHPDNTPSLSISPTKKGCWHCFGGTCGRSGNLFELAKKFTPVVYRQPDRTAEAIYKYRDEDGMLLYEVLRYRNPDGTKRFSMRQPASGGGMKYSLQGVTRVLYNLHLFRPLVSTVMLVEGEKDADTATNLSLKDSYGRKIVGTTSGGATSWEAEMASVLKEYRFRVIVMPDADDAGTAWLAAVTQSLVAAEVKHKVVSFAGSGCKDLSEYVKQYTVSDLLQLCDEGWTAPLAPYSGEFPPIRP